MIWALTWLGFALYEPAPPPQVNVVVEKKENSPAKAIDEYSTKIMAQGGDRQEAVLMLALAGLPPTDPESFLDITPKQMEAVRSQKPLRFGPGLLYHGRNGLDRAIQEGRIEGEILFTRVGHQWATAGFDGKTKDPAIFLMPTQIFNRYQDRGDAVLRIVGDRKGGLIDPYPQIRVPVPLSDFSEIWVGEDTYRRYRETGDGKVKALLDEGKIRAIPGLKAVLPSRDDPRWKEDNPVFRVGMHILNRNLLKEIPVFEALPGTEKKAGAEEASHAQVRAPAQVSLPELAGKLMNTFAPFSNSVFPIGAELNRSVFVVVDTTTDETGRASPERALLIPYLPARSVAIVRSESDLTAAMVATNRGVAARIILLSQMSGNTEEQQFEAAMRFLAQEIVPNVGIQIISGRQPEEISNVLRSSSFKGTVEYVAPATLQRMLGALHAGGDLTAVFQSGLFQQIHDNWDGLREYL